MLSTIIKASNLPQKTEYIDPLNPDSGERPIDQTFTAQCYVNGILVTENTITFPAGEDTVNEKPLTFTIPADKLPEFSALPVDIEVYVNKDNDSIFSGLEAPENIVHENNMANNVDRIQLVANAGPDLYISLPSETTIVRGQPLEVTAAIGWRDIPASSLPANARVEVGGQFKNITIETPAGTDTIQFNFGNPASIIDGSINKNNSDVAPKEENMVNNFARMIVKFIEPSDRAEKGEYNIILHDDNGAEMSTTAPYWWKAYYGGADYYTTVAYHPQWLSGFVQKTINASYTAREAFDVGNVPMDSFNHPDLAWNKPIDWD